MNDVGLVLVDDGAVPAYDRPIAALVHGLEERLLGERARLVTRIVASASAERAVYRTWRRETAVDAVVLMNVRRNDRRIPLLRDLELPFVAVTDGSRVDGFSAVTLDTAGMVATVLRFLAGRGHARIVYVRTSGRSALGDLRGAAFAAGAAAEVEVVAVDGSSGGPAEAAVAAAASGPCAVVFDDDASAVAAIERLRIAGRRVPDDVAVFAWNDSLLCQTADPPVSALNSRTEMIGDLVGVCLLRATAEAEPVSLSAPVPFVVARASA